MCVHSGNEQTAKGWTSRYSLWMKLVQSPVYSNGNLQMLHTSVFSLLLYNGRQSCPTQLGCSPGNSPTHLFHNDAVFTRAVEAELLQNPSNLEEGEPVAAQRETQAASRYYGKALAGTKILKPFRWDSVIIQRKWDHRFQFSHPLIALKQISVQIPDLLVACSLLRSTVFPAIHLAPSATRKLSDQSFDCVVPRFNVQDNTFQVLSVVKVFQTPLRTVVVMHR